MKNISDKSRAQIYKISGIINNLKGYWPLTLRQIYYQLVSTHIIDNNGREYQKLSGLLSAARMNGIISWSCMEDRSRTYIENAGWSDKAAFIRASYRHFLTGYQRDLMNSQEKYIEIWIEKDALSGIVDRVASRYCVPVVVARGFASMSFKNDFINRVNAMGKDALILYFGDFDPSGLEMLPAMMNTFEEMDCCYCVDSQQCALTVDLIDEHNLPYNPDAMKDTDSRSKKFKEEYGRMAVELDALAPDVLEREVEIAIENNIDMDLYESECRKNEVDNEDLQLLREKVMKLIDKPKKRGK